MTRRVRAALGLGANLGPRRETLEAAVRELDAHPCLEVVRVSSWIETEPVGGPPGQPPYLNGALLVDSDLAAPRLLTLLQEVERRHGRRREREPRNGPRTLDLDLLLFGAERHEGPGLRVPHPRLEERTFVLEPLAEIAPDLHLPSGLTVRQRLATLRGAAAGAGR